MVTTDVYAVPSKQVQDVFAEEASGKVAVAVRAVADTRAIISWAWRRWHRKTWTSLGTEPDAGFLTTLTPLLAPQQQVQGVFAEGASEEEAEAMRAVADARPEFEDTAALARQGLDFALKVAQADHASKKAKSGA